MAPRKRSHDEDSISTVCLWRGCASAAFETKEELFKHVNSVHVTQKGPCLWDSCEYVAGKKQHLNYHVRTHTGERPHECKTCHKTFTQASSLTDHKRTHTGERPHECETCHKTFIQSSHLTFHMRVHTGERPHECETCHKMFSMSHHLTIHKLMHKGERPHECETCHKTFTQLSNLTSHMLIHKGERPHKCDQCDKAFFQLGNLTDHKLRHHVGPWCVLCGACYVPEETMVCGRCNMGQRFGVKERTFFEFIYKYDERLAECCFTLRDQAMGCGVRKRPDGLMQLQTKAACVTIDQAMEAVLQEGDYRVKLIIEADEHQHQAYIPSCELARLQEIQERDGDAIYVLRYNVDQEGGLEEEKLSEFCEHLLSVLDGGFLEAVEEVSLIKVEYFGYTENRLELLEEEMARQQNKFKDDD